MAKVVADRDAGKDPTQRIERAIELLQSHFGCIDYVDSSQVIAGTDDKSMLMFMSEVISKTKRQPAGTSSANKGSQGGGFEPYKPFSSPKGKAKKPGFQDGPSDEPQGIAVLFEWMTCGMCGK